MDEVVVCNFDLVVYLEASCDLVILCDLKRRLAFVLTCVIDLSHKTVNLHCEPTSFLVLVLDKVVLRSGHSLLAQQQLVFLLDRDEIPSRSGLHLPLTLDKIVLTSARLRIDTTILLLRKDWRLRD